VVAVREGPVRISVVAGCRGLRTLAESRVGEVRRLAEAFFGQVDGAEPVGLYELLARFEWSRGETIPG